jgi:hypothetical protein
MVVAEAALSQERYERVCAVHLMIAAEELQQDSQTVARNMTILYCV